MAEWQGDLFSPYKTLRARQGGLYDDCAVELALSCEVCGEALIETASGYAACPNGHGKLLDVEVREGCGSWFEEE